jgi:hypothetical protein
MMVVNNEIFACKCVRPIATMLTFMNSSPSETVP